MQGGEIVAVYPDHPGARMGLKKGDRILRINGELLSHYLQYQILSYPGRLTLIIKGQDGRERFLSMEKEEGEPLGIEISGYIYDGLKRCENRCFFCFVDQQPQGMRETLYLKDDDYRFSFYQGAYISLTNLTPLDFQEIASMGLSPLYISIHTTNPSLRAKMLGNKKGARIQEQLTFLKESGISFHGQLVLCPRINDGQELIRTLHDLESYYPALSSLSLIPVGLTCYREGLFPLRTYGKEEIEELLDVVREYQNIYQRRFGKNLIYAADEFYLFSGQKIPPAREYDGFPQYENGVGLVSSFYQDLVDFSIPGKDVWKGKDLYFLTSVLGEKALQPFVENMQAGGLALYPIVVENQTFGSQVTVTGLLTGQDLLRALSRIPSEKTVIIPGHLLNDRDLFLDDIPLSRLKEEYRGRVVVSPPTGNGFLQTLIREVADHETTGGDSWSAQCGKIHPL